MRNENGFGSVVCLDKTRKKRRKPWAARITVGWEDGVQKRKYIGYYRTKTEAMMALSEYHKGGINLEMSNMTLNEVFDKWMERVVNRGTSKGVINSHKMAKARFGRLGNLPLRDIKANHLQTWLDSIDLKPGTKIKIKTTMNQMYRYALSNDIVPKNYAETLEINEKIEKTGAVFTEDELAWLWEHTYDDSAQQLLIMCYTGMRIGEMLKVKRSDINFEESYITGGSKTKAGRDRIIPIHRKIMPLIKAQLGDTDHLIRSSWGKPMSYPTAALNYNKLFETMETKHKPHDCRKTAISLMHSAGIQMEVIRIIVGHSGKGITEQVYLFKSPKELVEEINKIEINFNSVV